MRVFSLAGVTPGNFSLQYKASLLGFAVPLTEPIGAPHETIALLGGTFQHPSVHRIDSFDTTRHISDG